MSSRKPTPTLSFLSTRKFFPPSPFLLCCVEFRTLLLLSPPSSPFSFFLLLLVLLVLFYFLFFISSFEKIKNFPANNSFFHDVVVVFFRFDGFQRNSRVNFLTLNLTEKMQNNGTKNQGHSSEKNLLEGE